MISDKMLKGLDSVNWGQLRHAYGPADDVPDALRLLVSSDEEERSEGLEELIGTIWHQGTVYSATAAAVPFMVEIATCRSVAGRAEVLGLLGAIVESNDGPRDAHLAALERIDQIRFLLGDGDPVVRAAAAYVLGGFPEQAASVGPALRGAIDREQDALARAGMLLGVASLLDASPPAIAWLQDRVSHGKDPRERFAAAVALARAAREATPAVAIALLAAASTDPDGASARFEGLPWDMGAERLAGEALVAAGRAAEAALPVLFVALRTAEAVAASFILDDALAIVFPAPLRPGAPLRPDQLGLLRALIDADALWGSPNLFSMNLRRYGLPETRKEVTALLARVGSGRE
jgi:hypothetical protein